MKKTKNLYEKKSGKRINKRVASLIFGLSTFFCLVFIAVFFVLGAFNQNAGVTTTVSFNAVDVAARVYVKVSEVGASSVDITASAVRQNDAVLSSESGRYYFDIDQNTRSIPAITVSDVVLDKVNTTLPNGNSSYSSYLKYEIEVVNTGSRNIRVVTNPSVSGTNASNVNLGQLSNIGAGRTTTRTNGFDIIATGNGDPGVNTGTALNNGTQVFWVNVIDTTFSVDSVRIALGMNLSCGTVDNEFNGGTATQVSGNPATLPSTNDGGVLANYKIYGNSVQEGTPTPDAPVEVQSLGQTRNLLPCFNSNDWFVGNTTSWNCVVNNSFSRSTFPFVYSASQFSNVPVCILKVKPNTSYVFHNSVAKYLIWSEYANYSDVTDVAKILSSSSSAIRTIGPKVITTTINTHYIVLAYSNYENADSVIVDTNTHIMFEEGSVATPYVPHCAVDVVSSDGTDTMTTTIDLTGHEPLRKVGNVADELDFANSRIVRRVGKYVVSGTEDIAGYILYQDRCKAYIMYKNYLQLISYPYNGICVSNYYTWNGDAGSVSNLLGQFSINGTTLNLTGLPSLTTLSMFKAWLAEQYAAGTPVTIYYELATPTYEHIDLPFVPVYAGVGTVMARDEYMGASVLDVWYFSSVNHVSFEDVTREVQSVPAILTLTKRKWVR